MTQQPRPRWWRWFARRVIRLTQWLLPKAPRKTEIVGHAPASNAAAQAIQALAEFDGALVESVGESVGAISPAVFAAHSQRATLAALANLPPGSVVAVVAWHPVLGDDLTLNGNGQAATTCLLLRESAKALAPYSGQALYGHADPPHRRVAFQQN